MAVFGWIALILFALFGLGVLGLLITPWVGSEICSLTYKIKKLIEDKKDDANKKSEARRHRDEIRRQKENELADRKLEVKLKKVTKQIEIYEKRIKLAEELKQSAEQTKKELSSKSTTDEIVDVEAEIKAAVVEPVKVNTTTSTIPQATVEITDAE